MYSKIPDALFRVQERKVGSTQIREWPWSGWLRQVLGKGGHRPAQGLQSQWQESGKQNWLVDLENSLYSSFCVPLICLSSKLYTKSKASLDYNNSIHLYSAANFFFFINWDLFWMWVGENNFFFSIFPFNLFFCFFLFLWDDIYNFHHSKRIYSWSFFYYTIWSIFIFFSLFLFFFFN